MTRGKWHILRDGACWGLARQRTARFDFWSETVLPLCHPVRLMHQIRQDLWRALQRLRGFSPVIWLTPTAQGWDVRAGGAAATPIAPVWSERRSEGSGASAKPGPLGAPCGRLGDCIVTQLWKNQAFTICHADDGAFEGQGLRPFFEYRDLGIHTATQGAYGAHVIRAVPGQESPGAWHTHDLDFQMVYVTKGWVVFEYEGQGEHVLREGSCVLQPPGIKHREIRHSDDLELLEVVAPADFTTAETSA